MEKYSIQVNELLKVYSKDTMLKYIFRDIEQELKFEDQVVCQFIVNGIELHESEEAKFSELSLNDISTLEYLSEDSDIILQDVVENWLKALPEMVIHTEELAKEIRTQGIKGKVKKVYDLIENCDFLISSLISLKQILKNKLADTHLNCQNIEENNRKAIKEAFEAIKAKNFDQFSYILEYDLINCFDQWQNFLLELKNHLKGVRIAGSKINNSYNIQNLVRKSNS